MVPVPENPGYQPTTVPIIHTVDKTNAESTPTLQLLYHDPTRFHGGGILWLAWSPEYGIGVTVLVPAMTLRNIKYSNYYICHGIVVLSIG